ncbi:MAG: bifunctional methylenetetrahydrofolate dehydrogenase/methenyltetrahydrofolate cyclohydrolase FolD [Deltaproteobacteria bacterium]|nr:bifunctional methylenetetrahydrofolate dehydrogenase/methenyltetrahydrofolate cyclohydrolase FolD [Deltaproteobacteria bacterium]
MAAQILDGKALSQQVREEVKVEVDKLVAQGVQPGLHVVLVGEDPASAIYVRNKGKACEKVGINGVTHKLPEETSEADLLALLNQLNSDPEVDGILVQLPLPKHISEEKVNAAMDPARDVDGFLPVNLGKLLIGRHGLVACTPAGIMRLIDASGIDYKGKRAVVIGRSVIVGKPTALLLMERHASISICHSRTHDLAQRAAEADILVAAIGRAKMIKGDWVKEGAVVIDVGMNRDEDGKLCGDVDFAEASEKAAWITPVPGGVGPMTIAYLLRNTVIACCARRGLPAPFVYR